MNERYDIIKFIYVEKKKNNENITIKESIETWKKLEKSINSNKFLKIRRDDKKILLKFFDDEKNKEKILNIFNEESYINVLKTFKKSIEINNKLSEVRTYYKNYYPKSKQNDINIIEDLIKKDNIDSDEYFEEYGLALKKNDRFPIINYILESYNINKNNPEYESVIQRKAENLENLEKKILAKDINSIEKKEKILISNYFIDKKNKHILVKIFGEEIYLFTLSECTNILNKEKDKLKEILDYYNHFCFEDKKEEITNINRILEENFKGNYEKYFDDYEKAKYWNERYDLIKQTKEDNEIIPKKNAEHWEKLEKAIKDKKYKKIKNSDTMKLKQFLSEENNKTKFLKIFSMEEYVHFYNYNYIDEKKLKIIYNYYKKFLFESKKNEIEKIEKYLKDGYNSMNYNQYLKDLKEAENKNKIEKIIYYLLDRLNKTKTEYEIAEQCRSWKNIEEIINKRKIIKNRAITSLILLDYFNNEENKESYTKLFKQEDIDFFKAQVFKFKNLSLIERYYENFLFKSKADDIKKIKKFFHGDDEINYDEYSQYLETAKNMEDRYDIINYFYEKENENKEKTEEEFGKFVNEWNLYEKLIKNRKKNKIKGRDKHLILDYVNDPKNEEYTLKIFKNEDISFIRENFKNIQKQNFPF